VVAAEKLRHPPLSRLAGFVEAHWAPILLGLFQLLTVAAGLLLTDEVFNSVAYLKTIDQPTKARIQGWCFSALLCFGTITFLLNIIQAYFEDDRGALKASVAALQASESRSKEASRRMVGALVQTIHEEFFKQLDDDRKLENRTTLFVCRESVVDCVPGKRLHVFARGGRFKNSETTWAVHDDRLDLCEGFAGDVWYHETYREVTAANSWPTETDPEVQRGREEYAVSLRCSVDQAARLNVQSVALAGIPVWVRDQKWGVLILDSLMSDTLPDRRKMKPALQRYAVYLSSILGELGS
jgi:hypothetical protein